MKRIFGIILLMIAMATTVVSAADGFYTQGTKLMDANGNEFVMRGCNYSYAWQRGNEARVIPAAKRIGCNAIRIQLSTGAKWQKCSKSDLERLIKLCEDNKLIAVFNTHDETGSDNVSDLRNAANYWIEMKDVLNAHRKTVLVNISNEWYGGWSSQPWADGYKEVIPMLRNAGILNTLVVDAAGWGQYVKSIPDCGRQVLAADSKNNLVFSMHYYQHAANTDDKVRSGINNALGVGAPVIIGEFAYRHQGEDVAWQTILDYTKEKNVGYLVWSWTGNGGGAEECDMFGSYDDSNWKENGTKTVKGRNGIQQTSKECSIFDPNGGNQGGGNQGGGKQGGGDDTPGESTVLWTGSVAMSWNDDNANLVYQPDNSQWKASAMAGIKAGDQLVFSYTDTDVNAEIQLAIKYGPEWTWYEVVPYADVINGKYTFTITDDKIATTDYTISSSIAEKGFTVKGNACTLGKVELVKKGTSGGGNQGGGDDPSGDMSETVVENPHCIIRTWEDTYHIDRESLLGITSADKVRLYVDPKSGAEIQVVYKLTSDDWNKYVDYEPLTGSTYDIPMTDGALLKGVKNDGLYLKGHDYTIEKVSIIHPTSGIEETVWEKTADTIDFNAPFEIYTLEGRQVAEMLPGKLYILRQGAVVLKWIAR